MENKASIPEPVKDYTAVVNSDIRRGGIAITLNRNKNIVSIPEPVKDYCCPSVIAQTHF